MSETNTINLAGAITWFEVGTTDPARARSFYSELFGWTFEADGPYALITTGGGHTLGGGLAEAPAPYAIPYVQVDDVAGSCREVERLGGEVAVPATTTPEGIVFAHVTDPAGARLGLWTPPPGR